jgi:hypothetical protein
LLTRGIVSHKVHDLVHILIERCLGEKGFRSRLVQIEKQGVVAVSDDVDERSQIAPLVILIREFGILIQPLDDEIFQGQRIKVDQRIPKDRGSHLFRGC